MLKKEKLNIIRQWYPNAVTTIDNVNKLIDYVEEVLLIEPGQIMLADSICSDDVNSIQYPARAQEFLGPFKLGGLDGYPFTGLTGMGAFASHVPDSGAILIYYGPHIGVTKSGILGEVHRAGQGKNSGCCGAAKAATSKLLDNQISPGHITELDYQMNTLEQILYQNKERVISAVTPLYEATQVIYEAIEQRIYQLVEATKFKCRYVILIGGILINSDSDMGSFISIKKAKVKDLNAREELDILHHLI